MENPSCPSDFAMCLFLMFESENGMERALEVPELSEIYLV
jgi:hypothetical protein